ncbi:hypothetical protein EUX98_g7936 [Antrodiella citrinella]|uniref:Uncharacterized protein n=1 Tax=Antrodiella citrinella TaxID=2447956 RepID=A0A4S4MCL8_9APHY|nr:hypothetical protein EUX98_g7936 [Antrodiella citrinella]
MRLRNRKALEDKTPRNSPRPAKLRSPASKQASSAKAKRVSSPRVPSPLISKPRLPTPIEDVEEAPGTPGRDLESFDRDFSPSAAASARKGMPIQSTPLPVARRKPSRIPAQSRLRAAAAPTYAPPTPEADRPSSPLPPSSPPSDFEFTRKRISAIPIIPRLTEGIDEERSPLKLQVYRDPSPVEEEPEPAPVVQREASSDDPFGFLVVERKLKAQRAARKHPHRVISLAPVFKELARDSSEERVLPLRSDDDDLYADYPAEDADENKENIPLPHFSEESLQKVEGGDKDDEEDDDKENQFDYVLSSEIHPPPLADADEDADDTRPDAEEEEPAHPSRTRSTTEDSYDPLRTPHAAHVSKEIYPIRSPYSTQSTPCDRDLVIDSAPSSPSPSKPLQFATPLQSTRSTRKLGEMYKQSQEKVKGKRPAVPELSGSSAKNARVEREVVDEPQAPVESETPVRRPVRRSTRISAPQAGPSEPSPVRRTRTAAKRAPSPDSESESDAEGTEDDERSTKGKQKERPAVTKKAKASVGAPPTARRGRKVVKTVTKQTRQSVKAKGKRKATVLEDEDEEAAKARLARIDYFKKLDSDYSLAKENVSAS